MLQQSTALGCSFMRLTHLHADNFLSFADFELDDLDPHLTAIVGPNGAGKTNLTRVVRLAIDVLSWTNDGQPSQLARQYTAALMQGAEAHGFKAKIGVELNTDSERRMLTAWLRAALLSSYARGHSQERVEPADAHLMATIDDGPGNVFSSGSIVVQLEALPAPRFSVGYEFTVDGEAVCYVIRASGSQGGIRLGGMADQARRDVQARDGALLLTDAPGNPPSDETPHLAFTWDRLLPREGEFINLDIQEVYGWLGTDTAREFTRIFGPPAEGRTYMLDLLLTRILSQIVFVSDARGAPQHVHAADKLMLPQTAGPTEDTPLALLALKLGDHRERQRFQRAQQQFLGLTGANFDLQLQQTVGPSSSDQAPKTVHFDIGVDVADQHTVVPLPFAGAGRWEALILANALVREGTVTILDEPALNLHPTLQSRLLEALRGASSQTLLITHSPFLLPVADYREIQKIVRLSSHQARTGAHRPSLDQSAGPVQQNAAKLHQLMLRSSDARGLLFAGAALLVEGATEASALELWLPRLATEHDLPSPLDLNLSVISVDGDGSLGNYAAYLDMFGIPWAILCDGKALRLDTKKALHTWLDDRHTQGLPETNAGFDDVRAAWELNGVFTLAETFDDEIETCMSRIDNDAWQEVALLTGNKVHRGRLFAERVPPPDAFCALYSNVIRHLGAESRSATTS